MSLIRNVAFSLVATCAILGTLNQTSANAAVTFTLTGQVEYFTVEPASLAKDASANATDAQLYTEQQNVVLTKALTVYTNSNPLDSTSIAKKTTVDSFFLHIDQGTTKAKTYTGSITPSNIILGVIYTDTGLKKTDDPTPQGITTDDYLGTLNETYDASSEGFSPPTDIFSIDTNTNTLTFTGNVSTQVDDLRIVTSDQPFTGPEPSPALVLMAGLGMLVVMLAVRRRKLSASDVV